MELTAPVTAHLPLILRSPADVAAAYLAGFANPGTRKGYARDLRSWGSFLASIDVEVLSAKRVHVDAFARQCEANAIAPATLARRLTAIAGFYSYALDEGLIERNPVDRVRRPVVSDESSTPGLDRDELRRLLAVAENKPRDHALVCLLALSGLRVSEAVNAPIEALGWERGHRTLTVVGKGGKVATLPLAPRTAAAIDALVGERTSGPIFATRSGQALDRHAAWKIIRRLARAADVAADLSPHGLRHSFASAALDAGVPLHRVQDACRHADPRTTQRYNRRRMSLDGHATYAVASYLAE